MLEDDPDRAGDDALADAGDDAARHQHVLHGCRIGIAVYTTQSNASIKGPTEQKSPKPSTIMAKKLIYLNDGVSSKYDDAPL